MCNQLWPLLRIPIRNQQQTRDTTIILTMVEPPLQAIILVKIQALPHVYLPVGKALNQAMGRVHTQAMGVRQLRRVRRLATARR